MIQLNLLPDIKLEYIKAQRTRKLFISVAIGVSLVAVAILVLLMIVNGLQRKHLDDLSNDITTSSRKLQQQPEIDKILTVQNQLGSLTSLHATKPAASRLLEYLNQITPRQISISSLDVNFVEKTATITGTADTLSSVNKYVDTLKFTTYAIKDEETEGPAFSNVVLGSFGLATSSSNGKPATYTITFAYDPTIFDITKDASLVVPSQTSTRSVSQPTDLFEAAPSKPQGGNN